MKTVRLFCLMLLFTTTPFRINAQINQDQMDTINTTFSIEINADNTLEELTQIEKMLKEQYNTTVTFEDVKIDTNKIVALRMKLVNKNQSFMKTIDNGNLPIDPFRIIINEKENQNWVSIDDKSNTFGFDFLVKKQSDLFEPFSERFPERNINFDDFNAHFGQLLKQMEATNKRFEEMYKQLENDPEAKKEIINNEDGSTTTIISKKG